MKSNTQNGLIELHYDPLVRVSAHNGGETVWVDTSIYAHTSDDERRALADAHHLYPAACDHIMMDMGVRL